ncbi:MAG: DNA helicase RecQ [Bacteroidia bacterium]|nr:DNA helicase RecQ [Bacteroidia bacterium]
MNLTETRVSPIDALQNFFGFDRFKGEQESIIESLLDGKDTFVIMPTGGGKSLCYQLPALMMEGTALVISPLIALMKNQVDALRGYAQNDDVAHYLNSSLTKGQMKKVKEDIQKGTTKILYVAPETLTKEENIEFFRNSKISFVAVDEAHCISEWGHDFRPEYRRIRIMIEGINNKIPIIALTATATPKVQSDILKNLDMKNVDQFTSSFNREGLYYEIRPKLKKEETFKNIVQTISEFKNKSGIIYVQSRKSTEEIAKVLKVNGIKAAPYHAGLDPKTRSKAQDDFLMEEIHVIVATIAFGMGIDKPDVRFVIHFNIPKSIENYYQETGRAGRDGLGGTCIAYYSYQDIQRLEKFLRDKPVAERELASQLMHEIMSYSETSACRRQFLLHYFGENFSEDDCNKMCDNCRHPKDKVEVKEELVTALKAVLELKENYKIDTLVDFVRGEASQMLSDFGFTKSDLFGKGKDKDKIFWNSIFRQALLKNFLLKGIENYGIIKMTDHGHSFLAKPASVLIAINRDFVNEVSSIESAPGKTAALDNTLYQLLIDLRRSISRAKQLPPYVIFQDNSLEDMATMYPISMKDMANINGISIGKANRYGKPFLELIKQYVEDNDIERPTEFVVKSIANKSKLKVTIIQNIDRKLPLDEIARSNNISMDQLSDELDMIVNSGTKLDINYYLEEIMDDDTQEDIYDYFMDAESGDADAAYAELKDDDYTMEEIKLVRLKFLSEMSN